MFLQESISSTDHFLPQGVRILGSSPTVVITPSAPFIMQTSSPVTRILDSADGVCITTRAGFMYKISHSELQKCPACHYTVSDPFHELLQPDHPDHHRDAQRLRPRHRTARPLGVHSLPLPLPVPVPRAGGTRDVPQGPGGRTHDGPGPVVWPGFGFVFPNRTNRYRTAGQPSTNRPPINQTLEPAYDIDVTTWPTPTRDPAPASTTPSLSDGARQRRAGAGRFERFKTARAMLPQDILPPEITACAQGTTHMYCAFSSSAERVVRVFDLPSWRTTGAPINVTGLLDVLNLVEVRCVSRIRPGLLPSPHVRRALPLAPGLSFRKAIVLFPFFIEDRGGCRWQDSVNRRRLTLNRQRLALNRRRLMDNRRRFGR